MPLCAGLPRRPQTSMKRGTPLAALFAMAIGPVLGSIHRASKRFSILSTPPSRREWVWDWRSVAPLLRITAAGFGPYRMTVPVWHLSLRYPLKLRARHNRSAEDGLE